jgi:LPS-assembly lipoprotein
MRRRHLLASGVAMLAATGCGFALRGTPSLPFRTVAMTGFAPRSPLGTELRHRLEQGAEVLDAPARAEAVLQALNDSREKTVVATTSTGQVREVQLRVRFKFLLSTPGGKLLLPASELLLTRDMNYLESAALAKEQEEITLYRAMDADIAGQVLRRLSALKPVG